MVTIDGVDFKIDEPLPFDDCWFSYKYNHAGLRYEMGVCIQTGWIVWLNGPFPPGEYSDLAITRMGLNQALERDEKYLADSGYREPDGWAESPNGLNNEDQKMKQKARVRHECINGWFKNFGVLKQCFTMHHRSKHGMVTRAIANVLQMKIKSDDPPFQVVYDDNTYVFKHTISLTLLGWKRVLQQ